MTLFASLLARLGLSQTQAATLLDARLDSVKSWSSGRRNAPDGVLDELAHLNEEVMRLSRESLAAWQKADRPNALDPFLMVGENPELKPAIYADYCTLVKADTKSS